MGVERGTIGVIGVVLGVGGGDNNKGDMYRRVRGKE